jgi:hypothetical protein
MDGSFDLGYNIRGNVVHTVVLLGMPQFRHERRNRNPTRPNDTSLFLPQLFSSWPPILPCGLQCVVFNRREQKRRQQLAKRH